MKSLVVGSVFVALLALFSCGGDGDGWVSVVGTDGANPALGQVRRGLLNGNMEADNSIYAALPNGWQNRIANFNSPNNYTMERTDDFAFEGQYSLMIKATAPDDGREYPYFQQIIAEPNIRAGASVRLTAAVKTENLQGGGFIMYLLTPDFTGQNLLVVATSEFTTRSIRGNTDWTRYEATTPSFPLGIGELYVFLQLTPNATGTIYFDDVKLEVAN